MKFIKFFALVAIFATIFVSCEKQNAQADTLDLIKSKATLLQVDSVIGGYVGDIYSLNNQKLFVVKDNLKAGHNDLNPTGTLYVDWHNDVWHRVHWDITCEGTPYNCTMMGAYMVYFK